MCPGAPWSISQQVVLWDREETAVTTVRLLMFRKENRSQFYLEQLKMELNFLGSAFLFGKVRLRLSKLGVHN